MTMAMEQHVHATSGRNNGKSSSVQQVHPSLVPDRDHTVSPPLSDGVLAAPPESFTAVPNPFVSVTTEGAMPNTVSESSMTSVNWGSVSSGTPQEPSVPHMTSSYPPNSPSSGHPVMIAASGIRVPGTTAPPSAAATAAAAPAPSKRKSSSAPDKKDTNRRQKRLERNRESARLSRRRRKQYLEVLEDRVNQLSLEMDKGRREHVALAMPQLGAQRQQALQMQDLPALETSLARSSLELRVAGTFQSQQLQSLVFPPHAKFLLWLSLQTDSYFRGGRAASERLSAARIGERMLSSGNDRVSPAHGMWPLLCNDVGLSYDQEERIRCVQRALVQTPETWLERHTGNASGLVIQSTHDCMQALHSSVGDRERTVMSVLNEAQRVKFLQWAAINKERLAALKGGSMQQDEFTVSPDNHEAANLYIINHRIQRALFKLATPPALVVGSSIKRLSRRPSFESLGSTGSLSEQKDGSRAMSREGSFASSGSLKRSASELDMDDDKHHGQSVSPEAAEAAAQPTIDAALGFVKEIMPLRPQPQPDTVSSFAMPPPPKAAPPIGSNVGEPLKHPYEPMVRTQQALDPQPVLSAPVAFNPPAPAQQPSFLPQPLNAVPEEGFLSQQGNDPADDFLFELTEEDWAIGEGFEMDTT